VPAENFKHVLKGTIFVVAKDFSCWPGSQYAICSALGEREKEITGMEECHRRRCDCPVEGAAAGTQQVWVNEL
jgi:hypothetical protein